MLPLKLFLCRAKLNQLKKIKVGAVTYLNTKPLIYGMQQESFLKDHELVLDYPAKLAEMLKQGELDVALVPVALLPELPEYHIVSDYCIASDHEVASVCLFSEKPLTEIKKVYLDYQSKTSVALLKILFREHWKQEVEFMSASDESYIDKIQEDTAGLIIGDRALQFRERFAYRYDLATAWREMTGLPFVFAVWVSVREMEKEWMRRFNISNAQGVNNIDAIIHQLSGQHTYAFSYFKKNISFLLDAEFRRGMDKYLSLFPSAPITENI
jgi:chorismate dehydratase